MDRRKAVRRSRPVSYAASQPGLQAALLVSNVCVWWVWLRGLGLQTPQSCFCDAAGQAWMRGEGGEWSNSSSVMQRDSL